MNKCSLPLSNTYSFMHLLTMNKCPLAVKQHLLIHALTHRLLLYLMFIMVTHFNINDLSCRFDSHSWRGVFDATLCDKVCLWLATGLLFYLGTPVYSTTKTDRHDITEILLKLILNTHNPSMHFNVHDGCRACSVKSPHI